MIFLGALVERNLFFFKSIKVSEFAFIKTLMSSMSLNLAIFNYLMYMYIYLRYDTKEMFGKKNYRCWYIFGLKIPTVFLNLFGKGFLNLQVIQTKLYSKTWKKIHTIKHKIRLSSLIFFVCQFEEFLVQK